MVHLGLGSNVNLRLGLQLTHITAVFNKIMKYWYSRYGCKTGDASTSISNQEPLHSIWCKQDYQKYIIIIWAYRLIYTWAQRSICGCMGPWIDMQYAIPQISKYILNYFNDKMCILICICSFQYTCNGITLGIKSFYLVCSHSKCFRSNFEYALHVLAWLGKGILA